MDKFSLYVPNFLPSKEYFADNHSNTCIGCGVSLAARHIGKAAVELAPQAEYSRTSGLSPLGVKNKAAFLKIKNGSNVVLFCLDDEPLGDLHGAICKELPSVAVKQGYNYIATASPSFPLDLHEKVKIALQTNGKSYVHILCPCPAGWEFATEDMVKLGFWAVESRAFPLYEVLEGVYRLTNETQHPRSLRDYIQAQGRFSDQKSKDIKSAETQVKKEYAKLLETIGHQGAAF